MPRGSVSRERDAWTKLWARQRSRGGDDMAKQPMRVDLLVGRNIRICRLQRGLTQSELGGHLGVTPQQIQKYENGANRVGASRLDQIAGALEVSLATLFDGRPSNRNGHASNGNG